MILGRLRVNVIPLKNVSFVSWFTDHVVYLVRGKWNNDVNDLPKWGLLEMDR